MTFCSAPSRIGAGVDDDEVGRFHRRRLRRSPPRAVDRPSPPSRCGSSGSRASRRGSAAATRGPGRTRRGARRRARRGGAGAAVEAGALGGRTSRTGSERVDRRVSLTAAPWYARSRGSPAILERHGPRHPVHLPRDLGRPADADRARDRARHRQRHLHLDPRPAPAGVTSAIRPATSAWGWRWGCGSCCC